jgi:hypothetical protein
VRRSSAIMRAAFSAIMMVGELVLPLVMVGMIEASTTRSPRSPWTRSRASTTAIGSAAKSSRGVQGCAEPNDGSIKVALAYN